MQHETQSFPKQVTLPYEYGYVVKRFYNGILYQVIASKWIFSEDFLRSYHNNNPDDQGYIHLMRQCMGRMDSWTQ